MTHTRLGATGDRSVSQIAYNLFRNQARPEILCAVPQDRCVPAFITAHDWEFRGTLSPPADAPPGFNAKAARSGVRFNGFYLFQLTMDEAAPGGLGGAHSAEGEASGPGAAPTPRSNARRSGRPDGRALEPQLDLRRLDKPVPPRWRQGGCG